MKNAPTANVGHSSRRARFEISSDFVRIALFGSYFCPREYCPGPQNPANRLPADGWRPN